MRFSGLFPQGIGRNMVVSGKRAEIAIGEAVKPGDLSENRDFRIRMEMRQNPLSIVMSMRHVTPHHTLHKNAAPSIRGNTIAAYVAGNGGV